jgi:hypothetical protein
MTNTGPLINQLAQADSAVDHYIAIIRGDIDGGNPPTVLELTDKLLDHYWALAQQLAEQQGDSPNDWGPTLLALTLATAIVRLASSAPSRHHHRCECPRWPLSVTIGPAQRPKAKGKRKHRTISAPSRWEERNTTP